MDTKEMIEKLKKEEVEVKRRGYVDPYTIVDNSVLQNPELSWGSRGLYSFMKSLPKDWILYESWLVSQAPQGKDALRTLIKELEKFRFINKYTYRYKGQILKHEMIFSVTPIPEDEIIKYIKINDDGTKTVINEKPQSENPNMANTIEITKCEPQSEKPYMDKPYMENPQLQIKHDYKTNSYINQSVSHDEQTDLSPNIDILALKEEILLAAEINLYTGPARELLENTIDTLVSSKEIIVNNKKISQFELINLLRKLNLQSCDYALNKFREVSEKRKINNRFKYFSTILISAITESSANNIAI